MKKIVNNYYQKYRKDYYNYDSLINKDDIFLFKKKMFNLEQISKSKLMYVAKRRALEYGTESKNGNSFVIYNNDMNKKILVNRQGLTHSKGFISNVKRNIIINSAELLSNAIKLNEGYRDGKYSSILFNEILLNNELYIIRFIVFDNDLIEVESYKLNSLGVNKNGGRPVINTVTTISTISIKQLLEDVNFIDGYRNCLPLNVLYKLNGDHYIGANKTDIEGLKY